MEERIRKVMVTVWDWRGSEEPVATSASAAEARLRGLIQGAVGLAAALVLAFFRPRFAIVVAGIATATLLLALISPLGGYRRLTAVIQRVARWVGLLLTWILMPMLYYSVFLPLGLLLRLTGKLGVTRGADPELDTYWIATPPSTKSLDSYRRQF